MTGKPPIDPDLLQPVANGGLLDRRLFLKSGLLLSTASAVPVALSAVPEKPPWMTKPGAPFSNYGQPSVHEKKTIRWVMANSMAAGNGVSWTPLHDLEGTITPNGLHFERHHNGVPQIDPEQHRLLIHGLVRKPLFFTVNDLLRYPMQSRICFVECGGNSNAGWRQEPAQTPLGYVHGMLSCSEWTGVPLAVLMQEAGVKRQAKWLIAEGADAAAMNISIPIEKVLDDALVALYQNGERIRPENGYPMRLILPGWEGVMNVKWLRRLHVVEQPIMARNETAKYTELLASGKSRQFTFTMQAKSVITNPSWGKKMYGPGLYQVSGLAWSGNGAVKRVDVSADGGKTWAAAELQSPVLSKACTRFRIPWRWQGDPAILKSRVVDESGYMQPERTALINKRGRYGYFHYNAIVSWAIDSDGQVRHVYA